MPRSRAVLQRRLLATGQRAGQSFFLIWMLTKADGCQPFGPSCVCLPKHKESAMKPTVTWIVIADGNEAKIFEHRGPGKGLQAVPDMHFEQAPLKASEIMADKPGRSFSSAGPRARSSIAYASHPGA